MKKVLVIAAAVLCPFFVSEAMAVDENPGFGLEQEMGKGQQLAPQPLVRSYALLGETLFGARGEELGKVTQVLLDVESGRIAYLQVSSGGFLSIGTKEHLVPWQAVQVGPEKARLSVNLTEEQFKEAPAGATVATAKQAAEIYRFYGISPYWKNGAPQQPQRPESSAPPASGRPQLEQQPGNQGNGPAKPEGRSAR